MLQKHRKHFFAVLAVLLAVLLIWGISFYFSVPRLSREEKELVRTEFINYYFGGKPETDRLGNDPTIIWYEENWYIEEENVWRYLGKYGDCYAFLAIGGKYDALGFAPNPYPINDLAWTVYYPHQVSVYLYHTEREFYRDRVDYGYTTRMCDLCDGWVKSEKWLTDEQLEQLTRDIEKLAKDYN